MESNSVCVQSLLQSNSKHQLSISLNVLIKLLDNIIADPSNPKYRTIRLDNKVIREKLISANGMIDVLLEIGFRLDSGVLNLAENVLMTQLKRKRENILSIVKNLKEPQLGSQSNHASSSVPTKKKRPSTRPYRCAQTFLAKTTFPSVLNSANPFLRMIESNSDMVMQYEDSILQQIGRKLIPYESLQLKAVENLRRIQKAIKSGKYTETEPCIRDLLIVELVNWFKQSFFEWVDRITCKICHRELAANTGTSENGVRVEILSCCGSQTKFYRYNDITYLLRTRRGRCGEYANCFTFLCRCLGYDARYVFATFDHVWTEVYSSAQKRWIHVDPSDNVVDAPLMYQHGWKREIDYILAFTPNDIQDVTWRYTNNHQKILSNRHKCSEEELLESMIKIREKRQKNLTESQKRHFMKRNLIELAELLVERSPTENEKRGRSSGNLAWRLARGEESSDHFYIFTLIETEVTQKQFNLRYSCAADKYERYLKADDGNITVLESYKSWEACQYSAKNIFRKVERDWKMVYLARLEDTDNATISWKFDFSQSNMKVKNYSLKFETKTYENAVISVKILPSGSSESIIGSNQVEIVAELSGGKGDIAWQHTQLFRQSLESQDFPFDLSIILA